MPSPQPVTAVDVVWKSFWATIFTALGVAAIVLGQIHTMPSFYAVSVVLASTAVYYLQTHSPRAKIVCGLGVALLLGLAAIEQTVVVTVVSFIAVFVLAFAGRSAKFFWE